MSLKHVSLKGAVPQARGARPRIPQRVPQGGLLPSRGLARVSLNHAHLASTRVPPPLPPPSSQRLTPNLPSTTARPSQKPSRSFEAVDKLEAVKKSEASKKRLRGPAGDPVWRATPSPRARAPPTFFYHNLTTI